MVQRRRAENARRRHLKQATCKITLAASATKTPATTTNSSSCRPTRASSPSSPPSGKAARVAHEDLGRMAVEPEEAGQGPEHAARKHGQFAGPHDMRHAEVGGPTGVAGG